MKRILLITLALGLVLSCAACADNGASPDPANPTSPGKSPTTTVPSDPAATTVPTEPITPPTSFETQTVVDNEYCTIQITGLDPENLWGYTLNVYLENKSPDTDYQFSVGLASVNKLSMDPLFSVKVAPGKKANEQICFTDRELTALVGQFTDIELTFQVTDANDFLAKPVANPTVHVYPYGEENATVYQRPAKDTDVVVVDNDQVSVIVTEYANDPIWGYCAKVFLVNKTDKDLMFSADDVSVNGFMLDPFYADLVEGGKCAYSFMSWLESDFEDNGITDVQSIELTLRVYDSTDWAAGDVVNTKIELKP